MILLHFSKPLNGLKFEVEDCAFTSLDKAPLITDDAEEAFENSDYIIMVGAKPRSKGMERSDLIFRQRKYF